MPGRLRSLLFTFAAVLCLATACTRVTTHVSLPELLLGEPSYFPTQEAYGGAPIVGGNSVEILQNGENIFPTLVESLRAARRTITYAQYVYEDGPVSRQIAETLADRCRAGVGVSMLLDSFGSLNMPKEYADMMRASGCHVTWFRPLSPFAIRRYNNRNHRRVVVIDGRVGFTGGAGVSRKWMGNGRVAEHWRDTDVRVEGPAVEYLQAAFAENWLEATGMVLGGDAYFPRPIEPRGDVYVQVVRSTTGGATTAMYTTLLLALSSARRRVYVTNPYFVLDEKMTAALLETVGRGVKVVVLVPGAIDHNIVRQASRAQFGRMLQAGVEIYEYSAALLHAKTMVIDGVWATVGSTNLDNRSLALDEELNVIMYNRGVAGQMEQVFLEDLRHSKQVTYEGWKKRGFASRVLEVLALPIRDLL